jgi:transposase
MSNLHEERCVAMALLQTGQSVDQVAEQVERSIQWVRKWKKRFERAGYAGLQEQSRAPKRPGNRLATQVKEAVIRVRMELEAQAQSGAGLKYIGAQAIRTRMRQQGQKRVPSVSAIERLVHAAGLTRQKSQRMKKEIKYPHLHPQKPHELVQVDIAPHYLQGGERIACFNALDVVSRYPTGAAYTRRRSCEAMAFLIHVWQTLGLPQYTQVDNEGCFSGGTSHTHVLGQVVRLALMVGTELVFSPIYHPQSNCFVERFHQDYHDHVWEDTYLANLAAVNQKAADFFSDYRQSGHHSELKDKTPHTLHMAHPPRRLGADFPVPEQRLPLTTGRVHFMRRIQPGGSVRVLNVDWRVPAPEDTGVWVTLQIEPDEAWLRVYDAAPDCENRTCLVSHPFPLCEEVLDFDESSLPVICDSEATDSEATDSEATDSEATDSEATDSEATDSEATDSEATDSEATDSEATDSEATDSEAIDSEATDSEATDSEATDSEAIDSEAIDSEATDSEATDSEVTQLISGYHLADVFFAVGRRLLKLTLVRTIHLTDQLLE